MLVAGILGISAILQFAAAILAVSLVRTTQKWGAWSLIAAALALMGVRRSITLYRTLTSDEAISADVTAELVALGISLLLLVGFLYIRPLLKKLQSERFASRHSEERFRDIANAAADRFWETDADYRITYISPPSGGLHLPESAFMGKTLWDVAGDRQLDQGLSDLKNMFDQRIPVEGLEAGYAPSTGNNVYLRYYAVPYNDEKLNFAGYRGVSVDLSGEKNAELRYRQLFERANDGIVLIDPETRIIIDCNEKFAGNNAREEVIGDLITNFIADVDRSGIAEKRVTLAPGEVEVFDRMHRRKDGSVYPVEVSRSMIDIGDRVLELSFVRDLTARDADQRQLQLSERRSAAAHSLAGLGYFERDIGADTYYWSKTLYEIYGLEPDVSITFDRFKNLIHPDDRSMVETSIQDAIQAKTAYNIEFRIIRPDGESRILRTRAEMILDQDGSVTTLTGSVHDVTAERQQELQLRRSLRLEAMGQLTGGVAHDFNNILQVMIGRIEQLEMTLADNTKARAELAPLKTAADSASALTGRLLSFSRQQNLAPTSTNIFDLIDGLEDMLRRTLGETVTLKISALRHVWPVTVDPTQFENALVNLSINARDAMPDGGTLSIQAYNVGADDPSLAEQENLAPGDYVMMVVSDNGIGMSQEVRDRAFEPFFTTKQVGDGSGLGLSMVYGFVNQSNGHVVIESLPGWGTKLRLFFPRSLDVNRPKPVVTIGSADAQPGSERILLVEDDEEVRALPARFLRDQGYDVVEARDGKEAVTWLEGGSGFDMLFTDVVLPGGINGVEIAEKARRLRPDLKVLFTTGYAEDAVANAGNLEEGVNLMKKPYRRVELLAKIRSILDGVEA